MIVGNDIASFQGDPDFDLYSHNSNFIITKVTEGVVYINPKFKRCQSEARRLNLALGYYHFAKPSSGNDPRAEADFFIKAIGEIREGEVLTLDYEDSVTNYDPVKWCKAFLDRVVELTQVHPMIYLNKTQVRTYNWQPVADAGYGLWLACYDDNPITGAWKLLAMQQWTSSQQVPGIVGNVDGDRFFGSIEQFKMYGYHKPQPHISPSASVSPSASPSATQSPSISSSISGSQSPSASPSPSAEIPPEDKLTLLARVIRDQWNWFGSKGWYNQLNKLRKILNA